MSWQTRYQSQLNRTSWKTAHEDAHPHVDDMDDLQSHLMSHHKGNYIGDIDDHEWFHTDPNDYNVFHKINNWPIENHQPDHYHTDDYGRSNVPDSLPKSFANFNKLGDPGSLRGEGISGMIDPNEEVVGPQDLDSNATDVDEFPKSVGVFKNSSWKIAHDDMHPEPISNWELKNHIKSHHPDLIDTSTPSSSHEHAHKDREIRRTYGDPDHNHYTYDLSSDIFDHIPKHMANDAGGSEFGNPIDYNENRMQSLEAPGLEIKTPLDTGKRNYSEQRADANPLTLRSWFTGDDVNGPWPHTKNLSGPLDFEPTDNQNEDSTGPVLSSFQARYAHDDKHPWPITHNEATEHIISHHDIVVQSSMNKYRETREQATARIRRATGFSAIGNGVPGLSPIDAHIFLHKNDRARLAEIPTHEHDEGDLEVDIPDNIDTIAPTYVTSSWHQSNAEIFDTNPDEETPDSLLNPADELKNGRPRSTDLPSQNAQFLPGMLVDHDPMGGSDFGST